jgi:CMP-N,N'-diacetyllegionaminic acid synthase
MINNRKVLAIIPARGGSKGIPQKNIKEVAGKPLIAWTIEEAKKSRYIDRLILSSDDMDIINVAKQWNCEVPFVRPAEISQDDTPSNALILHAIENIPGFDYIVLLQPTSPLRTVEDIDGCIEKCVFSSACACVSVAPTSKSPYWMYTLDSTHYMHPVLPAEKKATRRQDLPETYSLNGAVYVGYIPWFIQTKTFVTSETQAYIMPIDRSFDIDSFLDLDICDFLLRRNIE